MIRQLPWLSACCSLHPTRTFPGTLLSSATTFNTRNNFSSRSCKTVLDKKEPTNRSENTTEGKNAQDRTRIKPSFPFKGTLNKCDVNDQPSCIREPTFTIYKENARDKSDGRTYTVCRGDEVLSLPSVTTVLNMTLPEKRNFMLNNWKKGMVKEFGEEGYQQVKDEIKAAGKRFHTELESKLYRPHLLSIKPQQPLPTQDLSSTTATISSLPPPIPFPPDHSLPEIENTVDTPSDIKDDLVQTIPQRKGHGGESLSGSRKGESSNRSNGYLESVNPVLANISDVYALESVVAHIELGYSGTCDCIATYRGHLCLIDWKTSSKPRPLIADLHDYPLQAVAYAGAVNQDPHYPFKVENMLIVTAYQSGQPCHVHLFPCDLCERYWDQWLLRLLQYQTLFSSDLSDICF